MRIWFWLELQISISSRAPAEAELRARRPPGVRIVCGALMLWPLARCRPGGRAKTGLAKLTPMNGTH